jgi:hypothetical protein
MQGFGAQTMPAGGMGMGGFGAQTMPAGGMQVRVHPHMLPLAVRRHLAQCVCDSHKKCLLIVNFDRVSSSELVRKPSSHDQLFCKSQNHAQHDFRLCTCVRDASLQHNSHEHLRTCMRSS